MKPRVSVCIITFNHVQYIEQALDSVLNQSTNFKFEIIIGDDSSTDGTSLILKQYQRMFPDLITVVAHNFNVGAKQNWLETFAKCRGDYIALLEGDDYWGDSDKLQKQCDFFDDDINKEFSICFHDSMVVNHFGDIINNSFLNGYEGEVTNSDIILGKTIPTQTVMFRREFVDVKILEKLKAKNQDTFLFTLLTLKGKAKAISQINKSVYRIHNGGIWSTLNKSTKYLQSLLYQKEICSLLDNPLKKLVLIRVFRMSREIYINEIDYKSYLFFKIECAKVLIKNGAIYLAGIVIIDLFKLTLSKGLSKF